MREGKVHTLTAEHTPARNMGEAHLITLNEARAYLLPLGFVLVPREGLEEIPYGLVLPDIDDFAGADVEHANQHEGASGVFASAGAGPTKTTQPGAQLQRGVRSATNVVPHGLTKRELGFAFDGIRKRDAAAWVASLEDAREGLKAAMTRRGRRGDKDGGSLWNPVGVALYTIERCKDADQRNAVMQAFAKAFLDRALLKPWRDAWQEARRSINGDPWELPDS